MVPVAREEKEIVMEDRRERERERERERDEMKRERERERERERDEKGERKKERKNAIGTLGLRNSRRSKCVIRETLYMTATLMQMKPLYIIMSRHFFDSSPRFQVSTRNDKSQHVLYRATAIFVFLNLKMKIQ